MNINELRTKVNTCEERLSRAIGKVSSSATKTSIKEFNGTVTCINSPDNADSLIEDVMKLSDELVETKGKLAYLNATAKLADGSTIQEALARLRSYRTFKTLFESLLNQRPSTRRKSDGSISSQAAYYEMVELNFDKEKLQARYDELVNEIDSIENEIQVLNSKDFDI